MADKDIIKKYRQQQNRIKRFINKAEERGYRFEFEMPKQPKKITEASVRKLKKIDSEYLYNRATYLDEFTGKVVSGNEGQKIERKLSQNSRKKEKTPVSPNIEDYNTNDFPKQADVIIDHTLEDKFGYWNEVIDEQYDILQFELNRAFDDVSFGRFSPAVVRAKYEMLSTISAMLDVSNDENRKRVASALQQYEDLSPLSDALHDIAFESETEKITSAYDLLLNALSNGKAFTADEAGYITELSEK